MKLVKIQGRRVVVEHSGRGYVTVQIPGTDIHAVAAMDADLKRRLAAMPYLEHIEPWKKEMARLEERALDEARRLAKKSGLRSDSRKS